MKKRGYRINNRIVYAVIIETLIAFILSLVSFSSLINNAIAVGVLILSICWIIKCHNNIYTLILSLFISYCNYSVVVGVYLDPALRDNTFLYNQISNPQVYGIGISLIFLFMLFLVISMPYLPKTTKNKMTLVKQENYSKQIFTISVALMIVCMVFGYKRVAGSRGGSSALYEYGIIFLLLMFFYSGARKACTNICVIMTALYTLTSILNGTRVEALACIIIFVLCYFRKGLKTSVVILGMLVGLFIFSTVGIVRGNWELVINGEATKILTTIIKNKMVFDTCTHAYFPMICMIDHFSTSSILSGMYYFFKFVISIFLGQTRVNDADLIEIVRGVYYHNFGGFTQGFFFVWFKFLGPVLFGLYTQFFVRTILKKRGKHLEFKNFLVVYFIATVGRWYLYGPWAMTRGIMICSVVFLGLGLLKKRVPVWHTLTN